MIRHRKETLFSLSITGPRLTKWIPQLVRVASGTRTTIPSTQMSKDRSVVLHETECWDSVEMMTTALSSIPSCPGKSRVQSQELVPSVYSESPATVPRRLDSGLCPSRNDLCCTGFNSKRGSSQVTPVIRAIQTPQRRESESSQERSPYHTFESPHGSRDPRAYVFNRTEILR